MVDGCILYRVAGTIHVPVKKEAESSAARQGESGSPSQPIRWLLVSPDSVFDQTDRVLWAQLQRAGWFQGQVDVVARASSWSRLLAEHVPLAASGWVFPSASLRRSVWQAVSSAHQGRLLSRLVQALTGRQLLLSEVKQAVLELQATAEPAGQARAENEYDWNIRFLETLQHGYLQGLFDWLPAMAPGRGASVFRAGFRVRWLKGSGLLKGGAMFSSATEWKCNRCGAQEVVTVACANCGREDCAYCPHCLEMGRVKACQPLLRWEAAERQDTAQPEGNQKAVVCTWQGRLSPGQQAASEALLRFVQEKEGQQEFLVWAVCGAGKTEMLFDMLTYVLNQGQKVLVTSPRRDVILELAPRLQAAFPSVPVCVLYGGSGERFKPGQLFLATTHQTLRFARYFDVVVIDEEDAFPYITKLIRSDFAHWRFKTQLSSSINSISTFVMRVPHPGISLNVP
ncbi:DEAD-like helicase [Caldalkalibacillus thermarum TA2.A1]|uniref:DEAD-like helicase n=1 Tax=Caldalkalibacillus thermarum (strain TA2.A1) TaxID=986075 RepID=F5L9B6_CALTT|nr:DEAD/DEAH box helicase family protein [Caldalkalibacillus thermarum]EGL82058.1 DEAD-like helicase [Caldalkalibacillus thermarum TA2.A1]QZT34023.1 DEAD/DEAH box helicase family protein [Caldalkalibacillus thermarum TA2.A1]